MKRTLALSSMVALTLASVQPLYAEGHAIAGADLGVMIPHDDLGDAVEVGAIFSPFAGYMFNDYIGIMGQAQVWAAKPKRPAQPTTTTPRGLRALWVARASPCHSRAARCTPRRKAVS